jgi:hypothetical protein
VPDRADEGRLLRRTITRKNAKLPRKTCNLKSHPTGGFPLVSGMRGGDRRRSALPHIAAIDEKRVGAAEQ